MQQKIKFALASVMIGTSFANAALAETAHEKAVRIGKIDKEVFAREHEIEMEREAGKITKEQAIEEKKAILRKSAEEHAR